MLFCEGQANTRLLRTGSPSSSGWKAGPRLPGGVAADPPPLALRVRLMRGLLAAGLDKSHISRYNAANTPMDAALFRPRARKSGHPPVGEVGWLRLGK